MRPGRPKKKELKLALTERHFLLKLADSDEFSARIALRAKILLMSDDNIQNAVIASELKTSPQRVCACRNRFLERGLEGVWDEKKEGRPTTLSDERTLTLLSYIHRHSTEPLRTVARRHGVSYQTVRRLRGRLRFPRPHRRIASLRNNELTSGQVIDIVGVYIHEKDRAFVICLEPGRPIGEIDLRIAKEPTPAEFVQGCAFHAGGLGAMTLYVALILTADPVGQSANHFRRRESFSRFLTLIEEYCPQQFRLQLVVDNARSVENSWVTKWWDQSIRWMKPVSLDSNSWLLDMKAIYGIGSLRANGLLTGQAVKRFASQVENCVSQRVIGVPPFQWIANPGSIERKVQAFDRIARWRSS